MINEEKVLHISMFRNKGYCMSGTKRYADTMGLNFKDLLGGKLTVRDLLPYKEDAFVKSIIESLEE